jgi:hypothetical protein
VGTQSLPIVLPRRQGPTSALARLWSIRRHGADGIQQFAQCEKALGWRAQPVLFDLRSNAASKHRIVSHYTHRIGAGDSVEGRCPG